MAERRKVVAKAEVESAEPDEVKKDEGQPVAAVEVEPETTTPQAKSESTKIPETTEAPDLSNVNVSVEVEPPTRPLPDQGGVEEGTDTSDSEQAEGVGQVGQGDGGDQHSDSGRWMVIAVILVLLVGLVMAGLMVYQVLTGSKQTGQSAQPTGTPIVTSSTPTPAASPAASLKRTDLKVEVLNGTTTAGLAAKAKTALEALGYTNVAVGNADTQDFQTTEVDIKDSKKTYLDLVKSDLSGTYTLSDQTKSVAEDSPYDVVVTLGTK